MTTLEQLRDAKDILLNQVSNTNRSLESEYNALLSEAETLKPLMEETFEIAKEIERIYERTKGNRKDIPSLRNLIYIAYQSKESGFVYAKTFESSHCVCDDNFYPYLINDALGFGNFYVIIPPKRNGVWNHYISGQYDIERAIDALRLTIKEFIRFRNEIYGIAQEVISIANNEKQKAGNTQVLRYAIEIDEKYVGDVARAINNLLKRYWVDKFSFGNSQI